MKKIKIILVLLPITTMIVAQTVNYNDVAVIINDSSQTSMSIGAYFQQKRNIPIQNMIHINCTTNEEIDSVTFENIRQQIENYLILSNITDSINYIVTTKGVPLKINRMNGDCLNYSLPFMRCSSFDSELSLMLGGLANNISTPTFAPNPYYNSSNHFSRNTYGVYLVTRLDGYTQTDIVNIIDKSGPNTAINKINSKFIFDVSYITDPPTKNLYINIMLLPYDSLILKGWNAVLDTLTPLLLNQQNTFGYYGISYDTSNQLLNNVWVNGSVAEVVMSGSCNTFGTSSNVLNQFIVADLIKEGATGAHGYTSLFYLGGQGLWPEILFNKYTDTTAKYNLAESYYMAMPALSSVDVVVGDPKTSIIIDNSLGINSIAGENNIYVFPNPNNGNFVLELNNLSGTSFKIDIYNNFGQVIYRENFWSNGTDNILHNINLPELSNGMYSVNISSDNKFSSKKFVVQK